MLSAGILGGPGLGYTQDRYASQKLQETSSKLYQEYAAAGTNHFLFFPAVQGLDGSKTGSVLEKAKDPSQTLTDEEQAVKDSSFYGGQMALKVTAAVPAVMALGFLLLIGYFKIQGGYQQIVLTSSIQSEPPAMKEY